MNRDIFGNAGDILALDLRIIKVIEVIKYGDRVTGRE